MKAPTTGNKATDILILVIGALVVWQIFRILKGIGDTIGESRKIDEGADEARTSKYFNPAFWTDTIPLLRKLFGNIEPSAGASLLFGKGISWYSNAAKEIYDAKSGVRIGTFGIGSGDNEEAVIDLFKKTNSQLEISLLCSAFAATYKRDLFGYLDSFMKNRTIVSLKDIADKKNLYPAAVVAQAKNKGIKI